MQPLFLTAAVAALFSSSVSGVAQSPRVQTTNGGIIIGHSASNNTSVTEFLGIRYAEAPVGELRFAAPKRYLAPEGLTFEASEWVRQLDLFNDIVICTDKASRRMYCYSPSVCLLLTYWK